MNKALVAGVGMTTFTTPRTSPSYVDMGGEAGRAALTDAGLCYADVQQVYAGYVYGDSTSGQRVAYELGLTGVPVINVNNNCATGSTALYLARQAVESGAAECVLALGFEQMAPGALVNVYADRPSPLDGFLDVANRLHGDSDAPIALRVFGGAARDHARRYGTRPETFASITVKARRHAALNPKAVFRDPVSVEEVLASPMIYDPVTRLQCCPPTCGGAAAVIVSAAFAKKHCLDRCVAILAQALTTDAPDTFEGDMTDLVGRRMSQAAATQVYEATGVGPTDIPVIELHDCFTSNEIVSYEALGLAGLGEAEKLVVDGDNSFGGRHVVNPSGGLLSKGHPLGATGLAQCYELVQQIRGEADKRQVAGARLGLQHNIGLGGACVVTLFGRAA